MTDAPSTAGLHHVTNICTDMEDIDTKNYEEYGINRESRHIPLDIQQKMLNHTRNERDSAFIAMLRETRQRIGALGTLRVGDVDPNRRNGTASST